MIDYKHVKYLRQAGWINQQTLRPVSVDNGLIINKHVKYL